MSADELQKVARLSDLLSDAVLAAWKRQESEVARLMIEAISVKTELGFRFPADRRAA